MARRWLTLGFLLLAGSTADAAQDEGPVPGNDTLPTRAVRRLGTTRLRHGSRILCLAYDPQGKFLAAGGGPDPVRLWNPATGQEVRHFPDPWVQALAFSPRGNRLATVGALKTVRVWDIDTGKEFARLDGHKAAVKALALPGEGIPLFLATGDVEGTIYLWDLQARAPGVRFDLAHNDEVTALALSADGKRLVSGGTDRHIHIWDIDEDNKRLRTLEAGCGVTALAFDAPGKTFFSAGDDGLIRRWDLRTGRLLATLKGHTGTIVSLQLSKDGTTLVSGAQDGTVRLWSAADNAPLRSIERAREDGDALALAPDGKVLATAGLNNTIRFYDLTTGKEVNPTVGPHGPIASLVLTADGKHLYSTSAGRIYKWDAATGKLLRNWSLGTPAGDAVLALSPDGQTLASGGATVLLWDPSTGNPKAEVPCCKDGNMALSLRFSPDGKTLAIGLRGQQVELWNWAQPKHLLTLRHTAPVYALAYSVTGSTLAAGGGNKLSLFEVATGRTLKQFDSREGPPGTQPLVASLVFSPDGKILAAGCYDGVIRLYDARLGKEVRQCDGHISVPFALVFARDGRTLASASFDQTVRLWEAFSGAEIASLKGHVGPVQTVALAPDDRTLYSAGADTTILTWDVPGLGNPAALPKVALTAQELESCWLDLASEEAPRAHRAAWRLIASARESIPFMTGKVYLLDPDVVRQLFKDLNAANYTVRNEAMKRLHAYGRWMEGRLLDSLKSPQSLESKRRSEQLLKELSGGLSLNQERLRMRRLMMILEQVADAAALDLFAKLALKAPEEELQEEAKGSLQRLAR
jgi:WD40 repeat protein